MVRVLHVIGAKSAGGAETFALRLLAAQQQDSRTDVVAVVREGSWLSAELKAVGIKFFEAPFRKWFDRKTPRIIEKIVTEHDIDVVQGWANRGSNAIPALTVPVIGRMGGYYKLKHYKTCDVVAGNTPKIRDYLCAEGLPENAAFYLPNFTNLPQKVSAQDIRALKQEYGLSKEAKIALIAGRLHQVKGVDTAIKALALCPDEKIYLLVLGQGPEEENLRKLAIEKGVENRVIFAGWHSEIDVFAAMADVWLAPSRYEPLGNIVLDAWAHKVPVIASKSDGPMMLITPDENGVLVEREDYACIAAEMARVLSNKAFADKMVLAGHRTLLEKFSKQSVLDVYLETYQALISEKKGEVSY